MKRSRGSMKRSILLGETSITSSIADDTTLMVESKEELKSLFDEGERGKEKNLAFKNATLKNRRSWLPFPSLHGK